jgi:hypothetical protein
MPSRLGPRFLIEAAFLILVAVGLGFADLSTQWIVIVMAGAWLLTAAVEWLAVRRTRVVFPARAVVQWPGEDVAVPVAEPPPSAVEVEAGPGEEAREDELVPAPVGWEAAPVPAPLEPEVVAEPDVLAEPEVLEAQEAEALPEEAPLGESEPFAALPAPVPEQEELAPPPRRRFFWRRPQPAAAAEAEAPVEADPAASELQPEPAAEEAVSEPFAAAEPDQQAEPDSEPMPGDEVAVEEIAQAPRRRWFWSRRPLPAVPETLPEEEIEEPEPRAVRVLSPEEAAREHEPAEPEADATPEPEPAEPEPAEPEPAAPPEPEPEPAAWVEEVAEAAPLSPVEAEEEQELWEGEAEPARGWSLDDTISQPAPTARRDAQAEETPATATPEAAAEPAQAPARASRSRLLRRHPQPREWNVWELERAVREHAEADPRRRREWNVTLGNLRQYANRRGALPVEFDPLVRETFRDLIESGDRG